MPPVQNELIFGGELYNCSYQLALYIMNKHLELQQQRRDRVGERLYDLCVDMKIKHSAFFNGIGNRLEINTENFELSLRSVMSEILAKNCNFGRIVSLYTFCIAMSEFCSENLGDLTNRYEIIANNTALALCDHSEWFDNHGAWDGFMDHFMSTEDKLWKNMMLTTVSLGAVAGLIYANS